jgi:hypothetical protein
MPEIELHAMVLLVGEFPAKTGLQQGAAATEQVSPAAG